MSCFNNESVLAMSFMTRWPAPGVVALMGSAASSALAAFSFIQHDKRSSDTRRRSELVTVSPQQRISDAAETSLREKSTTVMMLTAREKAEIGSMIWCVVKIDGDDHSQVDVVSLVLIAGEHDIKRQPICCATSQLSHCSFYTRWQCLPSSRL